MTCPLHPRCPLLLPALLISATLALAPQRAEAHAIESSLERLSQLSGSLDAPYALESRFGSGEPAHGAMVRLIPPAGDPLEVGRTDAEGRLQFRLPHQVDADWTLQVDGGPGHRDYLELPASQGQPAARRAAPADSPFNRPGLAPSLGAALIGLCGFGLALRRQRR